MKHLFYVAVLLLTVSEAAAQNTSYMARTGVFEKDGELTVEHPMTTLNIGLNVEKEEILSGPYARYAQKFLGVRAPLTDKTTYLLAGASIIQDNQTKVSRETPSVTKEQTQVLSHSRSDRTFARIQPDKTGISTLALEDAAREAANTIFSLRKHRLELITGEAGENVFGAGLQAALAEIDRLEQSYLELFLGKHSVTHFTVYKLITPDESMRQAILCRFSAQQGVLPQEDLSGEIVLLQFVPSAPIACPYEATGKSTSSVTYRIASATECSVLYGNRVLDRNTLPVFQFGRTAEITLPRKR